MKRKYIYNKEQLDNIFYLDDNLRVRRIKNGKLASRFHKSTGRNRIFFEGKNVYANYIAYTLYHGDFDQSLEIDHIDEDPLNDYPLNLRISTGSQNSSNRSCFNKHGLKGVAEVIRKGEIKYVARIMKEKSRVQIGVYDTELEAHEAYKKASKELHGEFSNTKTIG